MDATATAPARAALRALARRQPGSAGSAELKRQVGREDHSGEVVLERPWEAESMYIGDLLVSQHRWVAAGAADSRRDPDVGDEDDRLRADRQRRPLAGLSRRDSPAVEVLSWVR